MKRTVHQPQRSQLGPVVVIGSGIGGLASALGLVTQGFDVTVIERHSAPGGKMRQVPSAAGGVDAGPTVLTMRPVFEELFEAAGTRLENHVTLHKQDVLARHWWPGSGPLDLYADRKRSADAIDAFFGKTAKSEFDAFCARTETLWRAFKQPMIEDAEPDVLAMTKMVLSRPGLLRSMAPHKSMAAMLDSSFSDPRLRQLFGRYATYVGGSPYKSPAILSLIWQAEESGVWAIEGGMSALAHAIAEQITAHGGRFRFGTEVKRILSDSGGVTGVALQDGIVLPAKSVIFNGDPRALSLGWLGDAAKQAVPDCVSKPRSLSAQVWAFAAKVTGPELAHHNVFFCADPKQEFKALAQGFRPTETTLYICAEDRGRPVPPPDLERFEIILNAPPAMGESADPKEFEQCHQRTFKTLERFGLSFSPEPERPALTTPQRFDALFPGSAGSLYGQSPHGMFAALSRPRARTAIPGLYLCGGGCHPGAGVPMAALSGRHAAEAILKDRTSTLQSQPMDMRGGMSMRSRIVGRGRFRSSGS